MKTTGSDPPRSDSTRSQPETETPASTPLLKSFKTVLVVDDDSGTRELEVNTLMKHGYTVLQADGPVEALRLARIAEHIHLLVTDFSMPEANGLVLTRQFRMSHPATPVLMISGSVKLFAGKVDDLGRFALLEKPFTPAELVNKVRTLLTEIAPLPLQRN